MTRDDVANGSGVNRPTTTGGMTRRRAPLLVSTVVVLGISALIGPAPSTAEANPAEDTICDEAGLEGRAWGLCNAYCEAMDCDGEDPQASATACDKVHDKFVEETGEEPPCEVPAIECPCISSADLTLFDGIFACATLGGNLVINGFTGPVCEGPDGNPIIYGEFLQFFQLPDDTWTCEWEVRGPAPACECSGTVDENCDNRFAAILTAEEGQACYDMVAAYLADAGFECVTE